MLKKLVKLFSGGPVQDVAMLSSETAVTAKATTAKKRKATQYDVIHNGHARSALGALITYTRKGKALTRKEIRQAVDYTDFLYLSENQLSTALTQLKKKGFIECKNKKWKLLI